MSYDNTDQTAANEIERCVRIGLKVDEIELRFAVKYFASQCRMKNDTNRSVAARIISECAIEFGVSTSSIRSKSRFAAAWDARHCAIALMRAYGMTLNEIGAVLDKKRPNVCYSIKAVRNRLDTDSDFVDQFRAIALDSGVQIPSDWC